MRLLFLSNTRGNQNQAIYSVIRLWLPENSRIGYIPSTPDPARTYFKEVQGFFNGIMPSYMMDYINIHNEGEETEQLEICLRECDAVYLSGGNTFRFLKAIRDSGLDLILTRLAGEKVLMGTSAGGLIMTPSIEIASSENDIGLMNNKGLSLVKFGFYPHFIPDNTEQLREINACFDEFPEIYAIPEFSGLAVTETEIIPLGSVYRFRKGIDGSEILSRPIKNKS